MNLFPTAYFGSIRYYQLLCTYDSSIIEAHEHFVKQTLRTRMAILGPNGEQKLSVPVRKLNGSKSPMKELEILNDGWQKIHWKSIETAYASSAYFDYYGQEVKELIFQKETNLLQFNEVINQRIKSWLELPFKNQFSQAYIAEATNDFRTYPFEDVYTNFIEKYTQVFNEKADCIVNLSILDLIFNQGPMARNWLINPKK